MNNQYYCLFRFGKGAVYIGVCSEYWYEYHAAVKMHINCRESIDLRIQSHKYAKQYYFLFFVWVALKENIFAGSTTEVGICF